MFKAQKGSKDVIKIVHVTSVVLFGFHSFYTQICSLGESKLIIKSQSHSGDFLKSELTILQKITVCDGTDSSDVISADFKHV